MVSFFFAYRFLSQAFIPCASVQLREFVKNVSDMHTIDFGVHMEIIRFGGYTRFNKFFYLTFGDGFKPIDLF